MAEEKLVEKIEKTDETPEKKEMTSEKKDASTPAVEKVKEPKKKTKEEKVELEREYIVPLRKQSKKVPEYKRAKKAIKSLKEFLAKHMKVEDRDTKLVKIDIHLNNEIWFRGIRKPLHKIKVKAIKKAGIVYAQLAEVPEKVKYDIAREAKRAAKSVAAAGKSKKPEKKKEKEEKTDEKEKEKATAEAGQIQQKAAALEQKHTAKGAHAAKTMPVRKSLKK